MSTSIRPLEAPDFPAFQSHFARHFAESGRDSDLLFMPFSPLGRDRPAGLQLSALGRSLDETGWQRAWILVRDDTHVVGHVNLKGDGLRTGLHRCELGIGLERSYRKQRHGRALMKTAIEFAQSAGTLAWLDLRVFAHNSAGRRLYRSLEFAETGTLTDRFRIEGASIDDVLMSLRVG